LKALLPWYPHRRSLGGPERVAFDIFDCSGTPIGEAWGGCERSKDHYKVKQLLVRG